jgi:hypothetical protein
MKSGARPVGWNPVTGPVIVRGEYAPKFKE